MTSSACHGLIRCAEHDSAPNVHTDNHLTDRLQSAHFAYCVLKHVAGWVVQLRVILLPCFMARPDAGGTGVAATLVTGAASVVQ